MMSKLNKTFNSNRFIKTYQVLTKTHITDTIATFRLDPAIKYANKINKNTFFINKEASSIGYSQAKIS